MDSDPPASNGPLGSLANEKRGSVIVMHEDYWMVRMTPEQEANFSMKFPFLKLFSHGNPQWFYHEWYCTTEVSAEVFAYFCGAD